MSEIVVAKIPARRRSLGTGMSVQRVLPSMQRRAVGPYVFLDQMGPVEVLGRHLDIAPHPHIGLATVTYLYRGALLHRDSLGTEQRIEPGAVNWMSAGRGIVHSERMPSDVGAQLYGLQMWVALPLDREEGAPTFEHAPATTLPSVEDGGVQLRLLAGEAFGVRSPIAVASPLFQVDVTMRAGSVWKMPEIYEERALYVVEGSLRVGEVDARAGELLVLARDAAASVHAETRCRLMAFGGARLDAPRHIDWNFVSSSKERIEHAKALWRAQVRELEFPRIAADDDEFIALPG